MNSLGFSRAAGAAAVLAFMTSAAVAALTPFVGMSAVVKLAIPVTALAYLVFLLRNTAERTGRVIVLSTWCALAMAIYFIDPPMAVHVLAHLGAIWLVRSLYFYSGFLPALTDLLLSGLSLAALTLAIERTGSLFIGIWCLFLVQALFVFVPASIGPGSKARQAVATEGQFQRARHQAERILRQLYAD